MNTWLIAYPILFLILLFAGAKFAPAGSIHEDYLSLESAKTIQAFAALNIIVHHMTQTITSFGAWDRGPITYYNDIGIFFTAIFFFYSGYGLIVSFDSKPGYLDHFLRNRLSTVLIPFLTTNIVFYLIEGLWWHRLTGFPDILWYITGFKLLNGNAWFIIEIFILYLCFYLTHKFIKNKNAALIAMICCALILTLIGLFRFHNPDDSYSRWFRGEWWYNTTMVFVFGMLWGRFKEGLTSHFSKRWPLHLGLVLIATAATYKLQDVIRLNYGYYQEWEGHPGYGAKAVTCLAQLLAVTVFVLLIQVLAMKIRCGNKVMTFIGSISLELYLIHEIFRDFFYDYVKFTRLHVLIYFGVVLVISIGVAFLLHLGDRRLIKLIKKS